MLLSIYKIEKCQMVKNLLLRFIWVTMTYTLYTLITILDASMIGLLHHRKGHDSQWSFWFSHLLTLTFYCFNYQYQENQKYASGQNLWGTFFKKDKWNNFDCTCKWAETSWYIQHTLYVFLNQSRIYNIITFTCIIYLPLPLADKVYLLYQM